MTLVHAMGYRGRRNDGLLCWAPRVERFSRYSLELGKRRPCMLHVLSGFFQLSKRVWQRFFLTTIRCHWPKTTTTTDRQTNKRTTSKDGFMWKKTPNSANRMKTFTTWALSTSLSSSSTHTQPHTHTHRHRGNTYVPLSIPEAQRVKGPRYWLIWDRHIYMIREGLRDWLIWGIYILKDWGRESEEGKQKTVVPVGAGRKSSWSLSSMQACLQLPM